MLYLVVALVLGGPLLARSLACFAAASIGFSCTVGREIPLLIISGVISALLIGYSAGEPWTALSGSWWQVTAASIAFFAAPLIVMVSVFVRRAR